MTKNIRALGLFSGGLDSMLAAALLRAQGIDVTLICFVTPFFGAARARESAAHLNLPLVEVDFTARFLPLIHDPPRGFGRYHNPCIDCHTLMLREAGGRLAELSGDFLFTGEVLGQRPMSQNRGSLNLVAKESGMAEILLRPLSAQLLKATEPERRGLVDRERLLNLSGRGRKRQMALAAELGISRYPAPAGGCLLTDPRYSARLKELLQHQGEVTVADLELLKWGRHFRLPAGAKAAVGRTQRENEALLAVRNPMMPVLKVEHYPGPLVLMSAYPAAADLTIAAGLAAAYSDAPLGVEVGVILENGGADQILQLKTPAKEIFKEMLI